MTYEQQILDQIRKLEPEQQRMVLDFARNLGISGKEFLQRTAHIHIEPDDLKRIEAAAAELRSVIDEPPDIDLDG